MIDKHTAQHDVKTRWHAVWKDVRTREAKHAGSNADDTCSLTFAGLHIFQLGARMTARILQQSVAATVRASRALTSTIWNSAKWQGPLYLRPG